MKEAERTLKYMPEVDGLRTIAVVSVILYHFKVPYFSGGFVGVDIFFVISGFLITGIINSQLQQKNFSFSQFYMKRVRRLLPAMLTVYALCFVVAVLVISPQYFERFCGALIYALGSFSNLYFFQESGYFDADAYVKPLLHTWSLSVEEQFYFFWPLTLFIFKRNLKLVISLLTLFSLISSIYFIGEHDSLVFFMMPFRIFEFGIGASLVWLPKIFKNDIFYEIIAIIGFLLIGYSVVLFNEGMIFPGENALVPCIGAAFLIYSRKSHITSKLLRSSLALHIGKLSYSLYLVHWPVVVFYIAITNGQGAEFSTGDILLLLTITYLLSLIIFVHVENRFRYAKEKNNTEQCFGLVAMVVTMTLVLLASTAWSQQGWTWRMPGFDEKLRGQMNLTKDVYKSYAYKRILELDKPFGKNLKKNILVIGDSQGGDFVNMLYENGLHKIIDLKSIVIEAKCQPLLVSNEIVDKHVPEKYKQKCKTQRQELIESKKLQQADVIFIGTNWRKWTLRYLDQSIEILKNKTNAKIYLIGGKAQGKSGQDLLLENNGRQGIEMLSANYKHQITWEVNQTLSKIKSVEYVDVMSLICKSNNQCKVLTETDEILFFDKSHVTPSGAKYLGRKLEESGFFALLY